MQHQLSDCIGCRKYFVEGEKIRLQGTSLQLKNYRLPLLGDQKDIIRKTINSFINTHGGIILIGVRDSTGIVEGQVLDRKQMDHFSLYIQQNVEDFHPKVQFHNDQIKVQFVPIINKEKFFHGKYIIKIIIKQGNISKLSTFPKFTRDQGDDKYRAYQRLQSTIKRMSFIQIKDEIEKRAIRKSNIQKKEDHSGCHPQPLVLQVRYTQIEVKGFSEKWVDQIRKVFGQSLDRSIFQLQQSDSVVILCKNIEMSENLDKICRRCLKLQKEIYGRLVFVLNQEDKQKLIILKREWEEESIRIENWKQTRKIETDRVGRQNSKSRKIQARRFGGKQSQSQSDRFMQQKKRPGKKNRQRQREREKQRGRIYDARQYEYEERQSSVYQKYNSKITEQKKYKNYIFCNIAQSRRKQLLKLCKDIFPSHSNQLLHQHFFIWQVLIQQDHVFLQRLRQQKLKDLDRQYGYNGRLHWGQMTRKLILKGAISVRIRQELVQYLKNYYSGCQDLVESKKDNDIIIWTKNTYEAIKVEKEISSNIKQLSQLYNWGNKLFIHFKIDPIKL